MRTRSIVRRSRQMIWLSLAFLAVLTAILAVGFVSGAFEQLIWVERCTVLTGLMLLCLVVIWQLYVARPSRRLEREDLTFLNSEERSVSYRPTYCWSDSNRRVLERYQTITDRRALMELSIEATRYMALQQQINPHFLYNTLDAIRSDMLIAGQDKIADTVEALSKYFSYVVSNMGRLATIGDELSNVRDYFQVQKYRFEDRIDLRVEDELDQQQTDDLLIPRLTLQPLVENAIRHGIERSLRRGTVTIRLAETRQRLIIHVIDDGVGMDLATLERLNRHLDAPNAEPGENSGGRGGIALANVNSRIRLLFGEDYGLKVYSMEGAGTDVSILLPKVSRENMDEERLFADNGGQ